MNRYSKKNVILPISLHDTVITSLSLSGGAGGELTLAFADGFFLVDGREAARSGPTSIRFSGIDYDFSRFYVFRDGRRIEVTADELAGYIAKHRLEIIGETYGYNQTKLTCHLFVGEIEEVQIELYHFQETVYEWDDASGIGS